MEKDTSDSKQVHFPVDNNVGNPTVAKTWNNIEAEMLKMVLAHLHSPTNPKEMASRRLVCQHWRNVIDEHFEYWLTVNDTKMDLEKVAHVRVSNCTVVHFTKELDPQHPIFRSPESLSVWGAISLRNFHLFIQQAVKLEQLSLTCTPLRITGLMEDPPSEEQQERVQQFWNGLKTLDISQIGMRIGTSFTDNLCKILSKNMQNLSFLKIRSGFEAPDWERFITALYSFLGNSSNGNLKTFQFTWDWEEVPMPPPQSLLPVLANNQLRSLRLSLDEKLVPYWIPLIEAQRKLKDFRLILQEDFCERPGFRLPTELLHQALESTLPLNQKTLETVELTKLNLTDELDANLFRGMEKLTRLELRPCQFEGRYQKLLNPDSLPKSIETLVLGKVSVDSLELRLLVERLDNLKVLELNGTRIEGEFVMPDVFEVLTRKEKIRKITVNPLDGRFPLVSKNGKDYVIVNGYEMEVFWKNFDPSIHFTFPSTLAGGLKTSKK